MLLNIDHMLLNIDHMLLNIDHLHLVPSISMGPPKLSEAYRI